MRREEGERKEEGGERRREEGEKMTGVCVGEALPQSKSPRQRSRV